MKELDEKRADVPRTIPAQPKGDLLLRAAGQAEPDAGSHAGAVDSPIASHPANAAPLAQVLGQLQASHGNAYVQRMVAGGLAARPLDPGVRSAAEAALGEELGDVQLHTDEVAGQEADALGARAFARGTDIYFGPGEYRPESRSGQELLAHELAHVAQQRRGESGSMASRATPSADVLEGEAERAIPEVLAGRRAQVSRRAAGPSVQRKEKEKKEEAPSIQRHGQEIGPFPPSGTIDAAGHFTVAYFYNVVGGADSVPLTLAVPAGVAVSVVALNDAAGDVRVQDGGGGARAVTVVVTAHAASVPKIQATFAQGGFTYLVVFQFPAATKKAGESDKGKS